MNTMAAIYEAGEKFQARILFPDNLNVVEFFNRTEERNELVELLRDRYPEIDIVTQTRFQMELDHIHLFRCRWDDESIVMPKEDRLSTDEILGIIDESNKELDRIEEVLYALRPSPLVEDEDKLPV